MKIDVFSFEDFLNINEKSDIENKSTQQPAQPVQSENIDNDSRIEKLDIIPEKLVEDINLEQKVDESFTEIEDDGYYKLYKDINEEFSCDISIEGSSPEETYARLIIESEDWSLVFPGIIKNGKCNVPIKKLGILKEGEIGNIKLEVIAEGNIFIPWEDQFKVKVSKKVSISLNENKTVKNTKSFDVKVNSVK